VSVMTARHIVLYFLWAILLWSSASIPVSAKDKPDVVKSAIARLALRVPRIERAPTLEDFAGMKADAFAATMAHAEKFIQSDPVDGNPASQETRAYLGYDQQNLYVVFVSMDKQPGLIRAHMTRRENAFDDDYVEITLDTFKDQRRGFIFWANPLGIQAEGLWTEDNGSDWSWDTVWNTSAKRTDGGYLVIMAIPFRSLRFSPAELQQWGITLRRCIQRNNESAYWPRVSSKISGRLNQAGELNGIEKISPGRNMQFIPYGIARSYRAVDNRNLDPTTGDVMPVYGGKRLGGDVGLDAKMVVKDSLVLDVTAKPDFSQVESDEPQITVNQRFEVFFPEKRPFFLENSSYFDTPINLNFTRRIANPDYGIRLTGKKGHYTIGTLFADDAAPGKEVPHGDPVDAKKAYFGMFRLNRDIFSRSTIGIIYTERNFSSGFNRVGGIDGTFKWKQNWIAQFQGVVSSTRWLDGTYHAGPSLLGYFGRDGRKLSFNTLYINNAAGFETQTGFFRRQGIQRFSHYINYRWRPEGKRLVSFGPNLFQLQLYDKTGNRLDSDFNPSFDFNFKRNTYVSSFWDIARTKLRPQDYSNLPGDRDYSNNDVGIAFGTQYWKQLNLDVTMWNGRSVNYDPLSTAVPIPGQSSNVRATVIVKPMDKLQITNSYLLARLRTLSGASIFDSHTIRSKWNYQYNRELSFRVIAQYSSVLANPLYANPVSLAPAKGLNGDFLVTYLVHPGTAVYLGYNSNLQNPDPTFVSTGSPASVAPNRFVNDGRVAFIKVSYLFRY
jgi:hypothetical protein